MDWFYIVLYFYAELFGFKSDGANTGVIRFFDPLSRIWVAGLPVSGFVTEPLYTVCNFHLEIKFHVEDRHQ